MFSAVAFASFFVDGSPLIRLILVSVPASALTKLPLRESSGSSSSFTSGPGLE